MFTYLIWYHYYDEDQQCLLTCLQIFIVCLFVFDVVVVPTNELLNSPRGDFTELFFFFFFLFFSTFHLVFLSRIFIIHYFFGLYYSVSANNFDVSPSKKKIFLIFQFC